MRRSVLVRFLGLSLAVALGAVIATAVIATYSTSEKLQGELDENTSQLQADGEIYNRLSQYAGDNNTWSGVDKMVRSLADETGRRVALTAADGTVIADSAKRLGAAPELPSVPAATIDAKQQGSGMFVSPAAWHRCAGGTVEDHGGHLVCGQQPVRDGSAGVGADRAGARRAAAAGRAGCLVLAGAGQEGDGRRGQCRHHPDGDDGGRGNQRRRHRPPGDPEARGSRQGPLRAPGPLRAERQSPEGQYGRGPPGDRVPRPGRGELRVQRRRWPEARHPGVRPGLRELLELPRHRPDRSPHPVRRPRGEALPRRQEQLQRLLRRRSGPYCGNRARRTPDRGTGDDLRRAPPGPADSGSHRRGPADDERRPRDPGAGHRAGRGGPARPRVQRDGGVDPAPRLPAQGDGQRCRARTADSARQHQGIPRRLGGRRRTARS